MGNKKALKEINVCISVIFPIAASINPIVLLRN
jgi:hypothetical protein